MLTAKEQQVVDLLHHERVATKKNLCQQLQCSHMTVVRGLNKYGYYSSYNYNSAYYTLHDIPTFDNDGLWFYREIGFSRYGTLEETITTFVEGSTAGYTVRELEERLRAKVANLLSRVCPRDRLSRYRVGRQVVYLSADPRQQTRQKSVREEERGLALAAARALPPPGRGLPEELDALGVIHLLVEMIERPEASVASLSQTLQARGTSITAHQVRTVMEFYGLKKKRPVDAPDLT